MKNNVVLLILQGPANSSDASPTVVLCNLYVRSFEKIDDVKMEFSVQITFRQQWFDNRLMFDDLGGKIKYLTMTESDKVTIYHLVLSVNVLTCLARSGCLTHSSEMRRRQSFTTSSSQTCMSESSPMATSSTASGWS